MALRHAWPSMRRVTERTLAPLLRLGPHEALFATRGFAAAGEGARRHLERIGGTFVRGYNAALACPDVDALPARLEAVDLVDRGFAYEGAAMALAIQDRLWPWAAPRLPRLAAGAGAPHAYMLLVGAGWALARLRRRVGPALAAADPLLGWLMVDGYGFHEGYFAPARWLARRDVPRRLAGYERRAFDQGLGRSMWFAHGASVERIARGVDAFAPERRADLWSGVGLAAAYAGAAPPAELRALRAAAGSHRSHLAQGAAFAAKARQRAGNPAAHTDAACVVLCGCRADEAARATDAALAATPERDPSAAGRGIPRYERWRRAVARELGFHGREP